MSESQQSDPFRYAGGNRPDLGVDHQALLDSCRDKHARYASTADTFDPFRALDCWTVNYATPAEVAAVGFCEWNYQVHNGGVEQFFSNLHGFALYYIGAMVRVLEANPEDPVARELLEILRATLADVKPYVERPTDRFEVERAESWVASHQYARCCAAPSGLRIPIHEAEFVSIATADALSRRFCSISDDALIARMDQWLQSFAGPPR